MLNIAMAGVRDRSIIATPPVAAGKAGIAQNTRAVLWLLNRPRRAIFSCASPQLGQEAPPMTTVIDSPTANAPSAAREEQRILLEGISWDRFEQLSACFQDTRSVRLTYLDGSLEIVSPVGRAHEKLKRNISYLLEAYLDLKGIRFYGRGGFTLKKPDRAAGEPDESYFIGSDKPIPDLVVEIVVSSDALSKLPLYQALAIPEVWIWRHDDLQVYCLDQDSYPKAVPATCSPTSMSGYSPATPRCPTNTTRFARSAGPSDSLPGAPAQLAARARRAESSSRPAGTFPHPTLWASARPKSYPRIPFTQSATVIRHLLARCSPQFSLAPI